MSRLIRLPATLIAVGLLGACGTRSGLWDTNQVVLGPVSAASQLVWLNKTAAVLTVLDPTGTRAPQGLDVSRLPRSLAATPTGLLVVGGRGDAPTLDVIALPEGTRQTLHPKGAYDRIDVTADGHYAVLSYDPTVAPAPGGPAARNNNEIGVVDLQAGQITTLSLGTESVAPLAVVFSPSEPVVAVIMTAAVVFVKLDKPGVHVQIPLKLPDGTALHANQELFSADGRYLYVRTSGSDDVLSLDVITSVDSIQSSVNFLFFPGALGLVEIVVPPGPGFVHYVAALYSSSGSSTAVLLDAMGDTSKTHFVQVSRAATFLDVLGNGMLLMSGQNLSGVTGWEPLLDRSQNDVLPATASGRPRVVNGVAFFAHPSVSNGITSSAALTRVTLTDDGSLLRVQQSPLVLGGNPGAMAVDSKSGTLLIGVAIPRAESGAGPVIGTDNDYSGNTASIVTLNRALEIGGLVLDAESTGLGICGDQAFAIHQGTLGDVSFFPVTGATRGNARRVVGFLATHLMDQGGTP